MRRPPRYLFLGPLQPKSKRVRWRQLALLLSNLHQLETSEYLLDHTKLGGLCVGQDLCRPSVLSIRNSPEKGNQLSPGDRGYRKPAMAMAADLRRWEGR